MPQLQRARRFLQSSHKGSNTGDVGLLSRLPGSRPLRRPLWRRRLLPYVLIAPALVCLAVVMVYPIVSIIVESFYAVEPTRRPDWVFNGLANYRQMLLDQDLWASLVHTLVWTIGSVSLQFAAALAAASILRERFRLQSLLRTLLLVPWATPAVVGALAWKWMYHPLYGLLNASLRSVGFKEAAVAWLGDPRTAMGAAVATNVWRGFPFLALMLLAGLLSIPDSYYEAAAVDGASFWQGFRFITLPLLRPVMLVSTLLAGIWTFNNFSYIYILTGGGPAGRTDILVTFVYRNGFQYFHFGYAAALSVFLFLLVLAASLAYLRLAGRENRGLE